MPHTQINILPYSSALAPYFKQINIDWINKYFTIEPHDLAQLDNPEEYILKKGGHLLFAELNGIIVGTCALAKTGEYEFELIKMGVDPTYQGKKIGQALMQAAIDTAMQLHTKRLWLSSNTKLSAALAIYKKFGFRQIPTAPTLYTRVDITMELLLK